MRQIIKCIQIIDQLDVDLFNELNIGVELQDLTEPNMSDAERADLITRAKEILPHLKGVKAMHGPFLELKPASPDPLIKEVSQNRYIDALNVATEIGVDYIVFHSQIIPQLNDPFLSNLNNEQARDAWAEILDETNFQGTIVIENVFENTPEMLVDYMNIVDFPNMKVNLDIGHARVGDAELSEWLEALKGKIAYMHIHTNDGVYDQHLPMSPEDVNELYQTLDEYNLNPVLSLEYQAEDLKAEIGKYL